MPIRILLFISSYTPLWVILGVRFWGSNASYMCFLLAALGLASLVIWIKWTEKQTPGQYKITNVEDAGAEAAGYLASYLLPFFNVIAPTTRDLLVYAGFFITAGAIFVKSSIMRINPTLYMMGYWVLQIEDSTGRSSYLITRQRVRAGSIIHAADMRGGVLLLRSIA